MKRTRETDEGQRRGGNFAAIDFETASRRPNSACAIGVAIVRNGQIVDREQRLIRPPSRQFIFTDIHGLTWDDVCDEPTFDEVWEDLSPKLAELDYFAAHNASFDQGVLYACCEHHRLPAPPQSFICTVDVARSVFNIYPTKLPNVCEHLQIPLNHHDAESDALACAQIVLAARNRGWRPPHAWPGA